MSWITEDELDQLLIDARKIDRRAGLVAHVRGKDIEPIEPRIQRVLQENKVLREQAAERERIHDQELEA